MIIHVYKHKRKVDGKTITSRTYRGRYRLDGEFAVTEVALGTGDKQVAEKKLREIVKEKEQERAGIIAPKLQLVSAKKRLEDHLSDFLGDLEIQGRNVDYVNRIRFRTQRLFKECGWLYFKDVTPDSFVSWRSKQKSSAPKTLNEYLNAINVLINWCVKNGRTQTNSLVSVSKVEIRGKQQKRRAFKDGELDRLVTFAPERRVLYLTAAYTGLRLNELKQLVVLDAFLDEGNPHFKVRSSTTKNKKDACMPIHPNLVEEIRELVKEKESGDTIFEISSNSDAVFNRDLENAGIDKFDVLGRKVDFHALRYTFATKLARSGVSQRLAQELMRHSDPKLTAQIYTDASQLPTVGAIESLEWGKADPTASKECTQIDTQNLDSEGLLPSSDDATEGELITSQVACNEADSPDLTGSVTKWRMVPRGGIEPPLPKKADFESAASTNSATWAIEFLERCSRPKRKDVRCAIGSNSCKPFSNDRTKSP